MQAGEEAQMVLTKLRTKKMFWDQIITQESAPGDAQWKRPTHERVPNEPPATIATTVGPRGVRERAQQVHREQRHPGEAGDVEEVREDGDHEACGAVEGELQFYEEAKQRDEERAS